MFLSSSLNVNLYIFYIIINMINKIWKKVWETSDIFSAERTSFDKIYQISDHKVSLELIKNIYLIDLYFATNECLRIFSAFLFKLSFLLPTNKNCTII